jgi:hypothetical protein
LREKYDVYIPTAQDVDFNEVRILARVYADGDFNKELSGSLRKYIIDKLRKENIYKSEGDSHKRPMRFELTIRYYSHDVFQNNICPGKVLYGGKLELIELVNKKWRHYEQEEMIATWSHNFRNDLSPAILDINQMTLEKFEKDTDEPLEIFIDQYGPKKALIFPKSNLNPK